MEILARFGPTPDKSRQRYLEFIKDGVLQGRRDDLPSGGVSESLKAMKI